MKLLLCGQFVLNCLLFLLGYLLKDFLAQKFFFGIPALLFVWLFITLLISVLTIIAAKNYLSKQKK